MDDGIQMETIFGDGCWQGNSLMDKLFSAGKRLLTGAGLFMTTFTNHGVGKVRVAFALPYPGKIIPLDLMDYNGKIICQKDSFYVPPKLPKPLNAKKKAKPAYYSYAFQH